MAQQWPSWKWKEWRKDLSASSSTLNKAARTLGKGTTSKARQARRAHLQPGATQDQHQNDGQNDGWDNDDGSSDDGWGQGGWHQADDWHQAGWSQGGWYHGDWDDGPWKRDVAWWENSWERAADDSPPPGLHLELKSVSPGNRGRNKKRRGRRGASSSSSPGGWNRDRAMGLPSISEPDFSGSATPEKGKRQRQRSNSQSNSESWVSVATSNMSSKVWRKKAAEVEAERQAWLDAKEKKPLHKEASEKRDAGEAAASCSNKGAPEKGDSSKENTSEKGEPSKENTSEKGEPSKENTSEKGEPSKENTSEKGDGGKDEVKPQKKHLMVDYHKTLATGNHTITQESKLAMEKLLQKYDVTVCSWCFQEREKEVLDNLARQSFFPELYNCFCTRKRTGFKGKGWLCEEMGISAIFDDAADILKDALERGIAVYPITSKDEDHSWWEAKGHNAHPNFAAAVEAFLKDEEEK